MGTVAAAGPPLPHFFVVGRVVEHVVVVVADDSVVDGHCNCCCDGYGSFGGTTAGVDGIAIRRSERQIQ